MRVEMTFRRLWTADGIANYFWKARPVREGQARG
jgi:hydroxymethylglutaryl-CoA synthase